jgi:hypothetical protein
MAKGQPDFGQYAPTTTIAGLSDLGELAARLGSVVIFDRRGNVIAIDYFESGIEQWFTTGQEGYSVEWSSAYAKTGGFSCKLTSPAVEGYFAAIWKYIACPVFSSLGLEASFSAETWCRYLDFTMEIYDGSYDNIAGIRFDSVTGKLQYLDSEGNYQDVPGGAHDVFGIASAFDTLKFVADFTTGKYKRLIVSNHEFDLSAMSFRKTPLVETPIMVVSITQTSHGTSPGIAYIDDVIITQNEP